MSLKLYFHPLSSFCQKVLIALYENETPFVPHLVDFSNPIAAAEFRKIWPIGKFPVLRDEARDRIIPESSIIIEYLDQHHPGATRFLPDNPQLARQTRMRDRFFDLYLQVPMQKIVGDRLRPPDKNDAFGVEQARAQLQTALGMVGRRHGRRIPGPWATRSAWPTVRLRRRCTTPTWWRHSPTRTRTRRLIWTGCCTVRRLRAR